MSAIAAATYPPAPRATHTRAGRVLWTILFVIMSMVTAVELLVASLLLTFLMPKFAAIFSDFDQPAPWIARQVMALSQWLDGAGGSFAGWFIAAPLVFLAMALVIRAGLHPERRCVLTLALIACSALLITVTVFTWAGLVVGLSDFSAALDAGRSGSSTR